MPWGVVGAVAWAGLAREPGGERSRAGLEVAVIGTLLLGQILVMVLSAAGGRSWAWSLACLR